MSPLTQIHNATVSQPKLFPKFPMYLGGYCPHIFWHVPYPETTRNTSNPHYHEAIFSSSWITKDQVWAKPKRQSVLDTTLCLLQINTDKNSINKNLPHITSIYIDPLPNSKHLTNQQSLPIPPSVNRNLNTCYANPSARDIYNFAVNPNHEFSQEQKILITRRLLKFPDVDSGTDEMVRINEMWNTFQLLNAPAIDIAKPIVVNRTPPPLQEFPEIKNLLATTNIGEEQLCGASAAIESKPYVVADYPEKFGQYQYRIFFMKTDAGTSTRRRTETAYSRFWDTAANAWSEPARVSPAKSTICVMCVDRNPLGSTFGLPIFHSLNLYDQKVKPGDVYAFALAHTFAHDQQLVLSQYLRSSYNEDELQTLFIHWATKPQFSIAYP